MNDSTAKNSEPQSVRLTDDYLDLKVGLGFPKGTVLIRSPHGTGQYMTEETKLGQKCVAAFAMIRHISEEIP